MIRIFSNAQPIDTTKRLERALIIMDSVTVLPVYDYALVRWWQIACPLQFAQNDLYWIRYPFLTFEFCGDVAALLSSINHDNQTY